MNNARQGLRSERGQGIVEYILLLVVVLTLAFLLANRFFQPFQKWVNYYLGSYVECLLDQGELPGQGGENGIQDCEFQNPFEAGGSGTSGSGSGGRDGDTNTDKSKDGDGSDSSNSDSGRGGTLASRSGGAQRRIRVGGFDSPGGGKTTVAESETQAARSSGYFQISRSGSGPGGRNRRSTSVTGLSGLMQAEREKVKKREQKVQKVARAEEGGVESRGSRKIPYNPELKKPTDVVISGEEFSFGKLFRILLIIVIAIALILFVGGQLAQISKSMEK